MGGVAGGEWVGEQRMVHYFWENGGCVIGCGWQLVHQFWGDRRMRDGLGVADGTSHLGGVGGWKLNSWKIR